MKYDLDLSKAYLEELNDCCDECIVNATYDNDGYLLSGNLDDEAMNTFLFECFCDDDTVSDVWESIQENYFRDSLYNEWQCIDFDSQWFDKRHWSGEYPTINIYISENITLEVAVNIFFDVDWNINKGEYDAYCYHDYQASVIHIENIKRL
tara:strand:+ start:7501 stop:7953 length:453 start_codon:yes stop_codon:yes gene_type:complete